MRIFYRFSYTAIVRLVHPVISQEVRDKVINRWCALYIQMGKETLNLNLHSTESERPFKEIQCSMEFKANKRH